MSQNIKKKVQEIKTRLAKEFKETLCTMGFPKPDQMKMLSQLRISFVWIDGLKPKVSKLLLYDRIIKAIEGTLRKRPFVTMKTALRAA